MNIEEAKANIISYIKKCGYTYTIEQILENYTKYYLNGYYISHTTKDCIKNLENELKLLNKNFDI